MDQDLEDMSIQQLADPGTLDPGNVVRNGAVFVVPVDAPLPSELGELVVPTGSLYDRIRALCVPDESVFQFVPISGAEMLHLDRAWRLLQVAKRVFVLADLPGARYDVMFTQASRQIGLSKLDWPSVASTIASKAITDQRTKDSTPWQASGPDAVARTKEGAKANRVQNSLRSVPSGVVLPSGEDGESDARIG